MAKKTVEIELPELKDSTMIYLLAAVVILAQISTAYFTMQVNQNLETLATAINALENNAPSGNPSPAPSPSPQPAPQPTVVDVSADDDTPRGSPDAKVKIIMFSDYQCPYCGRVEPTVEQIRETYGSDVVIYFRDFPLSSLHPYAQKAAEAAECAGEQGKYWEMHDKLFENQGALDVPSLKQYAADLGLDTAAFNSCLDNGDMASEVQNDFNDGQAAGVSGTPTFFINGKMLVGAQPFDAFKAVIDAELA
jgi:protein-disulfide isomerase